ncbi:unnamed protein product, partial [Staurois parvus]
LGPVLCSLSALASSVWAPSCDSRHVTDPSTCSSSLPKGPQSLAIPCTVSAVSGHPLYCVRSLWPSPVLCPQSLAIPCTVSAVSGHPLYCVRSLWPSPVLCPQSVPVSGHPLYCVRSLWPSPVLCPPCTVSAVSGHPLYCVRSPLVQNVFFFFFLVFLL